MSEPLRVVVEHMARVLRVPPGWILLLLRDRELEPSATPQALGLGVADIPEPGPGELRLTVQGQDRHSGLGGCVPPPLSPATPQAQPLSWLMERYRAARGLGTCPLRFFFDGRRLLGTCTPEELGMEQDDIIEVWA
uniref:NFATC2-interacting protein n=1 Tax=Apteryx owenii TaxID=8824 RepID=A0A8B9QN33_APTOW